MALLDGLTDDQIAEALHTAYTILSRIKRALAADEISEFILTDDQALEIARFNAIKLTNAGLDEPTSEDPLELIGTVVAKAADGQHYMGDASKTAPDVDHGGFIFAPNYSESEYTAAGRLIRETDWAALDGETYKVKFAETLYAYSGDSLISETVTTYASDGTVRTQQTFNYYTMTARGKKTVTREVAT